MSATAVQDENSGPREAREAAGAGEPLVGAARYAVAAALMDSMLHDARNPLNALAIHLEVLAEKLKGETGQVPPSQEKNLKSMRDQIARLDGMLRQFCDFMAPRPGAPCAVPLSELVGKALEVAAHESRRRRLKVRPALEAGLAARAAEPGAARAVVLQALLRAYARAETGAEVGVALRREGARVVLEVTDGAGPAAAESSPEALLALELEAARAGAELSVDRGACRVEFPLAGAASEG